jgi:hypothetical protein
MNPIPVMVWTAQHDSTLLPKSLDDAERIADDLLGQETESHNPIYDVYQTFAAEMLAWMDQQKIPQLGAQASLYSDLRSGGRLNATQFYFENFPRDHRPLYTQFLNLAQAHQLVVYDTAGPLVFLPDGSSMPAAARRQLAALTNIYQLEEQNRNIHDIPTRFDQVPDWLKAQVDAHFAEYGFSDCVIQVDDDGALIGRAWKKTPAGLMILSIYVYELRGSLRIWGCLDAHLFDLFIVKKTLSDGEYTNKSKKYLSKNFDFRIKLEDQVELKVFFKKSIERLNGYIESFSDILSFYNYACENIQQDAPNTIDMHFFVRACMILSPENINKIKSIVFENEQFDEQCQLMLNHNIPTVAAAPAFYAEDLGMETSIIEGFKLLYT